MFFYQINSHNSSKNIVALKAYVRYVILESNLNFEPKIFKFLVKIEAFVLFYNGDNFNFIKYFIFEVILLFYFLIFN
jgi:hypothetical protein